ncbi:MAG: ribosomal-processing cysteine protease Prp, partial [Clostridia bacterium]|nr:ribosomal-processing cysteine protease Prp [Clostridia bacterium]
FKKNDKLKGIKVSGHTGFGEYGSDILCASISSIVQTAGLGLRELVSQKISMKIDPKIPLFEIILPDTLLTQQYLQAELILDTCILGLKDLQSGYPKNIKLEVKNDVY